MEHGENKIEGNKNKLKQITISSSNLYIHFSKHFSIYFALIYLPTFSNTCKDNLLAQSINFKGLLLKGLYM